MYCTNYVCRSQPWWRSYSRDTISNRLTCLRPSMHWDRLSIRVYGFVDKRIRLTVWPLNSSTFIIGWRTGEWRVFPNPGSLSIAIVTMSCKAISRIFLYPDVENQLPMMMIRTAADSTQNDSNSCSRNWWILPELSQRFE